MQLSKQTLLTMNYPPLIIWGYKLSNTKDDAVIAVRNQAIVCFAEQVKKYGNSKKCILPVMEQLLVVPDGCDIPLWVFYYYARKCYLVTNGSFDVVTTYAPTPMVP